MRLLWIFLALAIVVLVSFLIWGESLEDAFSRDGAVVFLKDYGSWGWLAGLVLLVLDLFLPIPGTVVMSALGFVYGPVLGGILASCGSILSGLTAYGLCRLSGERAAAWMLGNDRDRAMEEKLFLKSGGWIVALSRWIPILAEVISCMAGLLRMPFGKFFVALACGSLPLGFIFAVVGHAGNDNPILAIILSALIPVVLWLALQPLVKRMGR